MRIGWSTEDFEGLGSGGSEDQGNREKLVGHWVVIAWAAVSEGHCCQGSVCSTSPSLVHVLKSGEIFPPGERSYSFLLPPSELEWGRVIQIKYLKTRKLVHFTAPAV